MSSSPGGWAGRSVPGGAFLLSLVKANPHLFWTTGPDGEADFFNQRWEEYTGLSFEQSRGAGWRAAIHPDDRPRWFELWGGALAAGSTFEIELRLRGVGAEYRWFLVRVMPVRDDEGRVERWFGNCTDIDEARRAKEGNARLAAIIESSDDAIISKDLDGVVTSWNGGAERLFGYSAAEMIGQPIVRLIPLDRQAEEVEILARLRRGERIEHRDSVRVAKDGLVVDVSLSISPIFDGAGRIVGASKSARDITRQKRVEQELREAIQAAQEANQAKDRFLAVLSHELRTPLTPVLATISYLEGLPDLPPSLREEVVSIRRQVEMESHLIDDLLDVTRITRGKLNLSLEVFDVHAALRSALEVCQDAVEGKGLEVSLGLRARDHHVRADPARVQQVFWNLIQNAVKFTPEGGTISLRTSNPGLRQLSIDVADTGVGIEPEVLPRIFNAFEQAEQTTTRKYGGLGLGLTIAKSLVELHGGVITAHSAGRSGGSVFTVELATVSEPKPIDAPAAAAPKDTGKGLRILLVEDNPDTLRAITRLLRIYGFHVETAVSVDAAFKVTSARRFDLVVSDIGLPDGSGLEIMRHVRKCYGTRGIAFSGYGTDDDVRASKEAGFDHHLTKPVKIDELIGLILRFAS
jgi:PAS domain S-box-containing protein